jgi:hypothetical protein
MSRICSTHVLLSVAFAWAAVVCDRAQAQQVSPTPAVPSKCAMLAADYDQIEKAMASRWADQIGDNSAPRATLSEMRDANALSQAQIIITLMQANKCALPDHAPSIKKYLSAALACSTARLKSGADASECKLQDWTASK